MEVKEEVMKEQWKDEKYKAEQHDARVIGAKRRYEDPAEREKLAELTRKRWEEPGAKEGAAKKRKNFLASNPDFNKDVGQKIKETYATPEGKANKSAAMQITRNTPEAKAKVSDQFRGAKFYHRVLEDGSIVRTRTNKEPGEGWILGKNPKQG
jgi:hypothetical protein